MDNNFWYASDSDGSDVDDGEYNTRHDDIISRGTTVAAGTKMSWVYQSISNRGGDMYGNLSKRRVSSCEIKLEYNSTDELLLNKAKEEVRQSLHATRLKLFGTDNKQPINAGAALAAATPRGFLEAFNQYLKYSRVKDAPGSEQPWSFNDIITFMRCEKMMRLYCTSAGMLKEFGLSDDDYKRYLKVRNALTKADQPYSKRPGFDGASRIPANTFDPVINDGVQACNKEWTAMYFVTGSSWVDIDDDKYPNSSPLWKQYGMRVTPTKDKKLKPVFHVMAVIGGSYICWMTPDTLGTTLGAMLKSAIKHVSPTGQPSLRALLAFFLDRGYLELAKAQGVHPTNLIQIMDDEGVKFLGTMKDTMQFAFQLVDVNESNARESNGRPIVQMFGARTNFTAVAGNIQASVLRYGAGKIRGGRIATNLVEAKRPVWVFETNRQMVRVPNQDTPPPCPNDPTRKQQVEHAWKEFLAGVLVLTLLQKTVDWFLARLYCFTSTSFHASVNVKGAAYLNTVGLRALHGQCLQILRLHPRNTITVENAVDLEDEGLPTQRGNRVLIDGVDGQTDSISDVKCTSEYWLRGNKSLATLRKLCDDNHVTYNDNMQRKHLADALADKHRDEVNRRDASLLEMDVPADNIAMNLLAQVCFLQRMIPRFFMKPWKSKAGGAIEQGSANEDLVIRVLRLKVKQMSKDQYDIDKVREFGLLANRQHRVCASSPDGVFPLFKCNSGGKFDLISMCALEIKTRGTENTTDALIKDVLKLGLWSECVTGTQEFEDGIPDPSYRSQVCQHATALGLDKVLMVYSLPGGIVSKLVLVTVSAEHRGTLFSYETALAGKYMPFAYGPDAPGEIPSLGDDYSKAYGYAGEHHTLELYLHKWHAHTTDVATHGTPPPCRRLTDIPTNFWNKCMGNVDTVRGVLESRKAIRGPNSKPGSIMWLGMMGYIDYNALRTLQHAQLEDKLDTFTSFAQFQKARKEGKHGISFTNYLYQVSRDTVLNEEMMQQFFPGLKETINHGVIESLSPSSVNMRRDVKQSSTNNTDLSYGQIMPYLQQGHKLYKTRLNTSLRHASVTLPKVEGKNDNRGRCIVCCTNCINGTCDTEVATKKGGTRKFGREGRKTTKFCNDCNAVLCKHCHEVFHKEHVPLPACSPYHKLLPPTPRPSRGAAAAPPNQETNTMQVIMVTRGARTSAAGPSSPQELGEGTAIATPSPSQTLAQAATSSNQRRNVNVTERDDLLNRLSNDQVLLERFNYFLSLEENNSGGASSSAAGASTATANSNKGQPSPRRSARKKKNSDAEVSADISSGTNEPSLPETPSRIHPQKKVRSNNNTRSSRSRSRPRSGSRPRSRSQKNTLTQSTSSMGN